MLVDYELHAEFWKFAQVSIFATLDDICCRASTAHAYQFQLLFPSIRKPYSLGYSIFLLCRKQHANFWPFHTTTSDRLMSAHRSCQLQGHDARLLYAFVAIY
jgi:hypothetical protein